MKSFFLWWQNFSVFNKLFAIVGTMVFLIVFELISIFVVFETLSASRSMVGVVGSIAKAQKNAVFDLQNYLLSKNESDYQNFLENLKTPQGMLKARQELEKPNPNMETVRAGFLQAKAHIKDIDSMIYLLKVYKSTINVEKLTRLMKEGQSYLFTFQNLGEQIHQHIIGIKPLNKVELNLVMGSVQNLNHKFSKVQNSFSETMGEASRRLEFFLRVVLSLVIFSVSTVSVIMTVLFTQHLAKGLKELTVAAKMVGNADFKLNLPIRSNDELGQLASAINDSAEKLSQMKLNRDQAQLANQEKGLFLANMSHEIRTPLNAILGFSEFLVDPTLPEKEKKHYLEIVKRTGKNLIDIINDILDLSKIEGSHLKIDENSFSLSQLLTDLEYVFKARCQEKNLKLYIEKKGEIAEYIFSDPVRLKQILQNILGNAVKFTQKGSISLTYEVKDSHIHFLIQDTGPGISEENSKKLFQAFSQGDPSITKEFGGTGLGLMISQKLAQMLGGNVQLLKTDKLQGSTFEITVLYKASIRKNVRIPPTIFHPKDSKVPIFEKKRILVVEDAEDNRLLIQLYLNNSGAAVDFAKNGVEGLQKALELPFDAILMDIQMPVMDGLAATTLLREKGHKIPIIALSAYAMKEDQDKCLEAGCTAYLSKPVDRIQLINLLSHYI